MKDIVIKKEDDIKMYCLNNFFKEKDYDKMIETINDMKNYYKQKNN